MELEEVQRQKVLVLCILFFTNFFPWLHVKRCQSTEVRQFCLRLRVIEGGVAIIINHVVDAVFYNKKVIKLKRKTFLSDVALKCSNFQTVSLKKCYEIV